MSTLASSILSHLFAVEHERSVRRSVPGLPERVLALKDYQQRRFARTHASLLQDSRYEPAARFFLDDLYGPQDFSERDAQFARIVPALVRMFPQAMVLTVDCLAGLHALSEQLDSRMANHLDPGCNAVDARAYLTAWHRTGEPASRERQIELVLALGTQLDRYTRQRLLRHSLRLMRQPAQAAGLGGLQQFLERGFDTFAAMGGAEEFLLQVEHRERDLVACLFDRNAVTKAIGQLP
jgi:hypothetical protein